MRIRAYGEIAPAGGDTGTPLNLRKRLRLMERYLPVRGKRAIDCGCGAGEYVHGLLQLGAQAWGIELSREKLLTSQAGVAGRFAAGDLQNLPLRDSAVDIALLNEVIEHVPDDRRVLREVYRVLKPNGGLVLFSPNRRYPFETHGVRWKRGGRSVPHYLPLIPYVPLPVAHTVVNFWARNYWPGQLRRIVREAGFTIVHHDYVWQTFENISRHQPLVVKRARPLLRLLAACLERVPAICSLGASQVICAVKAPSRPALLLSPDRPRG